MPPLQHPPSDDEAIHQLLHDLTPDEIYLLLPYFFHKDFSFSRFLNPPKKGKKMPPLQHTPSAINHLDLLSDDLLLHILNYVSSDINSLCRCSSVSRRFRLVVPLVSSLFIPVDGIIIFDPGCPPITFSGDKRGMYLSHLAFVSYAVRSLVSGIRLHDPLQPYVLNSSVTHRTPVQVLKNFSDLRNLHIDLPSSEISFNDSTATLLRWRAHFGYSLDRCLILFAAASAKTLSARTGPESLYPKLSKAWTLSCLTVAARRHYLIEPIIAEHTRLERVVVTDADGQGVLCMDRDQLVELRKKPIWACLTFNRAMIPESGMWEWYAPVVKLSCGVVLKGVTLVAVQSSNDGEEEMGLGWIEEEFDGDGMYAEAVRLLLNERPNYEKISS